MGAFAGFQLKNTTAAMARKCPSDSQSYRQPWSRTPSSFNNFQTLFLLNNIGFNKWSARRCNVKLIHYSDENYMFQLRIQINTIIANTYLQVVKKSGTYHVQKLSQKDSCSDRYMVITTCDHFNQALQKGKKYYKI